ncbi:Probable glutamate receptor [Camponotus japonicus]
MNGIIWNKMQKTFVPISSVPIFAMIQQERYRQSRALETHNFQLQNLTVTSFKEEYFFDFYDNDTKITGVNGEIWILLSELLNFTLQPVRVNVDGMGVPEEDGIYKDGLLGYIPEFLNGRSKILEVSLGLFCSLIYIAFGAVLFIYMARNVYVPPFDSFTSLIANTKYSVVSLKGSTGAMMFKGHSDPRIVQARKIKRLIIISTTKKMEKLACFSQKNKCAIYESEDDHRMREHTMCHLIPTGRPLVKIWIASGIVKNFKYKRTVDLG